MKFESHEYHCEPNTDCNCLKIRGGFEKVAGKNGGL